MGMYNLADVPRRATTSDVFNAIGDDCRRRILTSIGGGEASVGDVTERLRRTQPGVTQPQVSKHLRVLREVDLVRCRSAGRQRLYRVNAAALRPVHDWTSNFEQLWNERYDRLDDLLHELRPDEPGRPDEQHPTRGKTP